MLKILDDFKVRGLGVGSTPNTPNIKLGVILGVY